MKSFILMIMTIWMLPTYAADCFYYHDANLKNEKVRVLMASSNFPSWSYDRKHNAEILVSENSDNTFSMVLYRDSSFKADIRLPMDTPFTLTGDKNDAIICK